MTDHWIKCSDHLPEEDLAVDTKIEDTDGCRNERPLKRQRGLWFLPDGSMYVYYSPTHWKPIARTKQ